MIEMFRKNEPIIGDHNWHEHIAPPVINGEKKGLGLVPRDYSLMPKCYSPHSRPFEALNMPLIPRNEWPERCREMAANKSRLSDIRRASGPNGGHIPSLDQGSFGYCWNHSATMCIMLDRAVRNMPYVRLSAFFVGCIIKNYRNEGGWGAQALDFILQHGIPSVAFWPEKSASKSNDKPETRANALLHRVSEPWMDMDPPVHSRNMSEDQSMTCLFNRQSIIMDLNHWGHSVAGMDPVLTSEDKGLLATDFESLDLDLEKDLRIYEAAFGKRFINSWTDSYGDLGEGVLTGSKAIIDGGAAVGSSYASAA